MNWKLHASIALYIISFMLPVVEVESMWATQEYYGWEISLALVENSELIVNNSWASNDFVLMLQYIWLNLANPCILLVIILTYAKSRHVKLKYILGTIALLSAVTWIPFVFSLTEHYFSYGYFTWIISILLIYFYSNDSSFVRPSKKAS